MSPQMIAMMLQQAAHAKTYGKNIDMLINASNAMNEGFSVDATPTTPGGTFTGEQNFQNVTEGYNKMPPQYRPQMGEYLPQGPGSAGITANNAAALADSLNQAGVPMQEIIYNAALEDYFNQQDSSGVYHGINWNDLNEPPRDWY